MIPSGIKEGKLYSFRPNDGTGDFTVVRNSTATYVDEDGLIKTALANVPRIDWSTGVHTILRELQSTNLVKFSNPTVSNLDFSIGNISNVIVDGVNGIYHADNNNTASYIKSTQSAVQTYTFSCYVEVFDESPLIPNDLTIIIDGSAYSNSNYSIKHFKNNIYKINATKTVSGTTPFVGIRKLTSNTARPVSVTRFQWELGNSPSSCIPTNGTTVTRLADEISVPTPAGVTSITEIINGVEQTPITTIPATYSLPVGNINKVTMQ